MADNASKQFADSTDPNSKLRHSCNNCHAAKVRCSGEKTGCRRCHGLSISCVYSISRVGKVVGNRGKYNLAKKKEQEERRQREQQQQNDESAGGQDLRSQQQQSEVLPPQQQDSRTQQEQRNKRQKHWTPFPSPDSQTQPSPQASLPPASPSEIPPPSTLSHQQYSADSRWQNPGFADPDTIVLSAGDSSKHPSVEATMADWMPLGDPMDGCGTFSSGFDDLLHPGLQGPADMSHTTNPHLSPSGSPLLLPEETFLDLPDLSGDDSMDFTVLPGPSLAALKEASSMASSMGSSMASSLASRPDGRSSVSHSKSSSEVFAMSRVGSPENDFSLSPMQRMPTPRERSTDNPRARCMLSCAKLLSTVEIHYDKLQSTPTGKGTQTLDGIMETSRRTTEAVRNIITANGGSMTYGSVRILIMVLELITKTLHDVIVKAPEISSHMYITFGAYNIAEGDQKWLRKRLLCTEVQRTFDLVKALRANCAMAKSEKFMCPNIYDSCLQVLQRNLKQMFIEVRGGDEAKN